MRKNVTEKEKEKMWRLYQTLGSYTKVAKKVKRNPDTVSKYEREYEAAVRAAADVIHAKSKEK